MAQVHVCQRHLWQRWFSIVRWRRQPVLYTSASRPRACSQEILQHSLPFYKSNLATATPENLTRHKKRPKLSPRHGTLLWGNNRCHGSHNIHPHVNRHQFRVWNCLLSLCTSASLPVADMQNASSIHKCS